MNNASITKFTKDQIQKAVLDGVTTFGEFILWKAGRYYDTAYGVK